MRENRKQKKEMISKIHHTGIWVNDIEKLLPFYRNFLGMKVVMDMEIPNSPIVDILTGIPGARVKAVFMEMDSQACEFLQLVEPKPKSIPSDTPYAVVGRGHLCFQVEDIQVAYKRLEEQGVRFVCAPQALPGLKMFYFLDPEGNLVEMIEPES